MVSKGRHAIPCRWDRRHIPCTGTKGPAIVVDYLNRNGGSTAYKGRDVSLSLDIDWRSLPGLTLRRGECEVQREMGDGEGEVDWEGRGRKLYRSVCLWSQEPRIV